LGIPKSSRHELHIIYGLTLMTLSLGGWETFPMPGALTHTKISWAFSSSAPQVPGVTPGSPLCHGVLGILYGEVCDRSGHICTSKITRGSYENLKPLGLLAPTAIENVNLAPTLGRKTNGILTVGEEPYQKL
jgi:hypothetical protein